MTVRELDDSDGSAAHVSEDRVFAFFSNRLGCLGSIVVSIIGTLFLLALMNLLFR